MISADVLSVAWSRAAERVREGCPGRALPSCSAVRHELTQMGVAVGMAEVVRSLRECGLGASDLDRT